MTWLTSTCTNRRRVQSTLSLAAFLTLVGWDMGVEAQTQDDYAKWLEKAQIQYQQFRDVRDAQFVDFLQKEWQELQVFQGLVRDKVPKPVQMPVAKVELPVPAPAVPEEVALDTVSPPPEVLPVEPRPLPEPVPAPAPQVSPALPPEEKLTTAEFLFYDTPLSVTYEQRLKASLGEPVDKQTISAFWAALSQADYENFLSQLQRHREQMQLNDWGYFQLVYQAGASLYSGNRNQAILFMWFVLTKSGYETKVGYDKDRVYLLVASGSALYSMPYFAFGNDRFYLFSPDDSPGPTGYISTYEGRYPGAERRLDLQVRIPPRIGDAYVRKELSFSYGQTPYQVPVRLDQNMIRFFARYPQTDYEIYFDASPSPEARASLTGALRPLVAGKLEVEAVNMILHFVQMAFGYEVDAVQFGREKALFPEETLFYPFSDCEDRAVLFAYLVKDLLGLEVIGLDYPGHIATAVRFSQDPGGEGIAVEGSRYTICDPTYLEANAGVVMPQYKEILPKVIHISH